MLIYGIKVGEGGGLGEPAKVLGLAEVDDDGGRGSARVEDVPARSLVVGVLGLGATWEHDIAPEEVEGAGRDELQVYEAIDYRDSMVRYRALFLTISKMTCISLSGGSRGETEGATPPPPPTWYLKIERSVQKGCFYFSFFIWSVD